MMSEGLRAQGASGGRSGRDSVLGPGGNYSPENVRKQADTMSRGIFSDLSRSGITMFGEGEEGEQALAGALDGFFQRAGSQQASGELPTWVDDTMARDLFTISAALSAAESRGAWGKFVGHSPDFLESVTGVRIPFSPSQVRGDRGQPELSPADTLRLMVDLIQNDQGGGKWTAAGGSEFRLSDLKGPAARLYGDLASRIRPMLEQEGE